MAKKRKAAHEHSHECEHGHSFDEALGQMKATGLKRTRAREAILSHLVEHHGPFSAKELQAALDSGGSSKRAPSGVDLDTVTVYRCLASFEESGLVRRCDFGDGTARFELRRGDHHHHHVICTSCRKIEKLEDCRIDALEAKVKALGYAKVRHVLEFSGVCRKCSRKA